MDIAVAGRLGLWLFSHVVELLRLRPKTPTRLRWSDTIPINYVAIRGAKLRYIKVGSGRTIVLLHTLRTQLGHFLPLDRPQELLDLLVGFGGA
jgi:hypothetical protein